MSSQIKLRPNVVEKVVLMYAEDQPEGYEDRSKHFVAIEGDHCYPVNIEDADDFHSVSAAKIAADALAKKGVSLEIKRVSVTYEILD